MVVIGVVLATLFLFAVMRWWSEGMFETSDAILLAVVFCGLIFGLFASREIWQFLIAFIPLAAAGGYAIHEYLGGSTRAYLKQQCQEYIRAIECDPRNLGARQYLAETLYNLGELDRAIDEMQVAVNMGAGIECQYNLGKWVKQQHLRDTDVPVCRWCMTENQRGARKCSRCGADLPYESPLSRWLAGGRTARARYYLILTAGTALVAISLALLPLKFAFIPLLLCLVALGGWSLISSARA